jgi:hypothetical protein
MALQESLEFPFCSAYPTPLARDFITLSEMPQAVLGITCDLCQRREQFEVEALKAQHGGDVKMPELLSRLVAIVRGRGSERSASMIVSGGVRQSIPLWPPRPPPRLRDHRDLTRSSGPRPP